jgi:subfamily B ATP-binding cassette protein HlyB/CyaB
VSNGPLFATGTFIWGLSAICQLHRRPFALNLTLQQFPPPHTAGSLQAAATALSLKSGLRSVPACDLGQLPPPVSRVLAPATHGGNGLAVVLRCDGDSVLCLTEEKAAPSTLPLCEFDAR